MLYRERIGGLVSIKRRGRGVILIGAPVLAVCDCGYVWRNPSLASVLVDADGLTDCPDA